MITERSIREKARENMEMQSMEKAEKLGLGKVGCRRGVSESQGQSLVGKRD